MKNFAVSLDFEHAPIDFRSQAILAEQDLDFVLSGVQEKVFLKTCNRVEIYGFGDGEPQELLKRWIDRCQLGSEAASSFRIFHGREAIRHLFRVTSSLESMVVGETQITGQMKRAYDEACTRGWVNTHLHRLFQSAFRVAKRIRSETEIGRLAVSVPSVGVKLAEKVLGDLSDKVVGVLGLGEIGRVAAEHFYSVGPKKLVLWNRTLSVSESLSQSLGENSAVQVEVARSADEAILCSDVLVSALDVSIVTEKHLKQLDDERSNYFILDLGVPPQVPRISLSHGFLFGVDDLKSLASENSELRQQEMQKANALIDLEVARLSRQDHGPLRQTLSQLSEKMNQTTKKELEMLRARMPQISDRDWAEVEKMAYRLSSKVLQDPVVELRSRAEADEEASESWLEYFKSLFRIS